MINRFKQCSICKCIANPDDSRWQGVPHKEGFDVCLNCFGRELQREVRQGMTKIRQEFNNGQADQV